MVMVMVMVVVAVAVDGGWWWWLIFFFFFLSFSLFIFCMRNEILLEDCILCSSHGSPDTNNMNGLSLKGDRSLVDYILLGMVFWCCWKDKYLLIRCLVGLHCSPILILVQVHSLYNIYFSLLYVTVHNIHPL